VPLTVEKILLQHGSTVTISTNPPNYHDDYRALMKL